MTRTAKPKAKVREQTSIGLDEIRTVVEMIVM